MEGYFIIFKRVSFDYKTQENTENETKWLPGTEVIHHLFNPISECGKGKFHACAFPAWCDIFRKVIKDKYVAIAVAEEDFSEYIKSDRQYHQKIAFKKGKVLYECDRNGKEIINLNSTI